MMTKPPATAVQVRRTIAAPPERVYRAWLDPQLMAKWFAPAVFTVRKAEVDERVGGRLSIWHADGEGNDVGGSESEIGELVPANASCWIGSSSAPTGPPTRPWRPG